MQKYICRYARSLHLNQPAACRLPSQPRRPRRKAPCSWRETCRRCCRPATNNKRLGLCCYVDCWRSKSTLPLQSTVSRSSPKHCFPDPARPAAGLLDDCDRRLFSSLAANVQPSLFQISELPSDRKLCMVAASIASLDLLNCKGPRLASATQ